LAEKLDVPIMRAHISSMSVLRVVNAVKNRTLDFLNSAIMKIEYATTNVDIFNEAREQVNKALTRISPAALEKLVHTYRSRMAISRSLWKLIFNKRWLHLYQILGDSYLSLREWIVQTRFKKNSAYAGKDVPELYSKKRYKEIIRYINEELILQEKLLDWMRGTEFYRLLIDLQHSTNLEKTKGF
jgi:hypothetical protein